MSKNKIVLTFIFSLFMLFVLSACGSTDPSEAIPAVEQTQFQRPPEDMRNFRYCEILPIFQDGTTLHIQVYATMGLNDCPDDVWQTLSADAIAEEYGAVQVNMNGPRFWLVNKTSASGTSAEGKIVDFDDLETLGERLNLPEGWSYQARVLSEDSRLVADGLAFVLNDDLMNSYQKVFDGE